MAKKSKGDLPEEETTPPGTTPAKPPAKKPELKSARGHYRQKECPYCHTHVGNLGNHIRLKHPTEAPPVEMTRETLLGEKKPVAQTNAPVYYCNNCHAELRKNENPCWHCSNVLNWAGIT